MQPLSGAGEVHGYVFSCEIVDPPDAQERSFTAEPGGRSAGHLRLESRLSAKFDQARDMRARTGSRWLSPTAPADGSLSEVPDQPTRMGGDRTISRGRQFEGRRSTFGLRQGILGSTRITSGAKAGSASSDAAGSPKLVRAGKRRPARAGGRRASTRQYSMKLASGVGIDLTIPIAVPTRPIGRRDSRRATGEPAEFHVGLRITSRVGELLGDGLADDPHRFTTHDILGLRVRDLSGGRVARCAAHCSATG